MAPVSRSRSPSAASPERRGRRSRSRSRSRNGSRRGCHRRSRSWSRSRERSPGGPRASAYHGHHHGKAWPEYYEKEKEEILRQRRVRPAEPGARRGCGLSLPAGAGAERHALLPAGSRCQCPSSCVSGRPLPAWPAGVGRVGVGF